MKKLVLSVAIVAQLSVTVAGVEIVLPQLANAVEQTAAEELAEHWQKATGETPVMVTNATGTARWTFRLGRAARLDLDGLTKNDAEIRISANEIDIAGIDGDSAKMSPNVPSGTLFGMYSFLERELGVHWLWPGELGTICPKRSRVVLVPKEWIVRYMAFSEWRAPHKVGSLGWADKAIAQKFYGDQDVWLRRHRFSKCDSLEKGHAYTKWFGEYGKVHPEWFNELPDGTRRSDPLYSYGRPEFISLCVSNRDLVKEIVRRWTESNDGDVINGNENDTAGKCCCANCLAADMTGCDEGRRTRAAEAFAAKSNNWFRALGSISARYAAFYASLLAEGRKMRPDCRVIAGIYANYSEPPAKGTRLGRNVILRYCPPVMYPWTDEKVNLFKSYWQGWAETGASLMMRPNFTLDGHNFPLVYYKHYADCYDFVHAHGLSAVDMDSLMGVYGANGLTTYVIAAKNSRPDATLAALEDEYFAAFGSAASVMRDVCAMFARASADGFTSDNVYDTIEGGKYSEFIFFAHRVFPPELLKSAGSKIKAAMAAERDPVVASRLRFVLTGLGDALLVLKTQRGFVEYQKNNDRKTFASAYRELIDFRHRNESLGYLNMATVDYYESRHWPRHLAMIGENARELGGWELNLNFDHEAGKWKKIDRLWYWRPDYNGVGWYRCRFNLTDEEAATFGRIVCGAVDGLPTIYLNGKIVQQGHPVADPGIAWRTPFAVSVGGVFKAGENELLVRLDKKVSGRRGITRPVFIDSEMEK